MVIYADNDCRDGKNLSKPEAWAMLLEAKGTNVVVKTTFFEEKGAFPTSISVRGTLEIGPYHARVLVEDDVYAYFSVDEIVFISRRLSDGTLTILLTRRQES
jgi:hypothetical protein